MSTKQLARQVEFGRKSVFHFFAGDYIEGYLCGHDDYHWLVITPEGTKHLVHKGSVVRVDLLDEQTYHLEDNESLESVVGPYRDWLIKEQLIQRRELVS